MMEGGLGLDWTTDWTWTGLGLRVGRMAGWLAGLARVGWVRWLGWRQGGLAGRQAGFLLLLDRCYCPETTLRFWKGKGRDRHERG